MDCDSVKIQLKRVPMNDESGQHDVLLKDQNKIAPHAAYPQNDSGLNMDQ